MFLLNRLHVIVIYKLANTSYISSVNSLANWPLIGACHKQINIL